MIKKILGFAAVLMVLLSVTPILAEGNSTGGDSEKTGDITELRNSSLSQNLTYSIPATICMYFEDGLYQYETVKVGTLLKEPTAPDIEGYIFEGWYIVGTDQKWDFSQPVESNLELEARYSKISSYIKDSLVGENTSNGSTNTSDRTNIALFSAMLLGSAEIALLAILKLKLYSSEENSKEGQANEV